MKSYFDTIKAALGCSFMVLVLAAILLGTLKIVLRMWQAIF
ncbi:hypothetical protein QUW13_02830 [Enterococcus hirae]|nr:hypothetical protein [Enterococcus hirae]